MTTTTQTHPTLQHVSSRPKPSPEGNDASVSVTSVYPVHPASAANVATDASNPLSNVNVKSVTQGAANIAKKITGNAGNIPAETVSEDAANLTRDAEAGGRTMGAIGVGAPVLLGAGIDGITALSEGKSTREVFLATAHGGLNGMVDLHGGAVALDSKQRIVDRILGGASAFTSGLTTGAGVATLTPAAPVSGPIAFISGTSNVGIGLVQDVAHWTGVANNPGTMEKTYDALQRYEELCQKNEHAMMLERQDPLGTYMKKLSLGNEGDADAAYTVYQTHLLYLYRNGQLDAESFKAADSLAMKLHDNAKVQGFKSVDAGMEEMATLRQPDADKARLHALEAAKTIKPSVQFGGDHDRPGYVAPSGAASRDPGIPVKS